MPPITDELKSINPLEKAGFSSEQAKAIAEVQESAIQRGFERFVEVLDHKLGEMESRIQKQIADFRTELKSEMADLRTEMADLRTDTANLRADLMKEQRDQMLKFAASVSLIVAVAGTVLKLL